MENAIIDKITEFVKYCIEWNKYQETHEYKKANLEYKKIKRIFEEIRVGDEASKFYNILLSECKVESVIVPAATQMLVLNINIEKAQIELKKIVENGSSKNLRFNAKMVLNEWNKGNLTNF